MLRLTAKEGLQMRVTPRGAMGNPSPDGLVVVSTRIFNSAGDAVVSTAFLWQMPTGTSAPAPAVPVACVRSMGCRCCHALLPSLFNHHDAAASEENPLGTHRFACLDAQNYQSLRSSTHTVIRYECDEGVTFGRSGFSGVCSTTPGFSVYTVAAASLGCVSEETSTRSHETIPYSDWHRKISDSMNKARAHAEPRARRALRHARRARRCRTTLGCKSARTR